MKTIGFISLILIMFTFTAMTQNNKELELYIEEKIVGKTAPGFQFVVAADNNIEYTYHSGFADVKQNQKTSDQTVFKLFSATKVFTAVCILQLQEKGLLSINDPVSKHLPEYKFTKEITIIQLLTHTAGVSAAPMVSQIHLNEESKDFNENEWAETYIHNHLTVKGKPGTKKKYSNFSYLVLGKLIEKLSGESYTSYVEKNIINKLALKGNYLGFEIPNNAAVTYQKRHTLFALLYKLMVKKKFFGEKLKKWRVYKPLHLNGKSYGGLFGNATALAIFGSELIKDNSVLLNQDSQKILFSTKFFANQKSIKHTGVFFAKSENGTTYYNHPGGGGGASSELRIYPNEKKVMVYMMNQTQTFSDFKILSKLNTLYKK